jgi:hypothetical protein
MPKIVQCRRHIVREKNLQEFKLLKNVFKATDRISGTSRGSHALSALTRNLFKSYDNRERLVRIQPEQGGRRPISMISSRGFMSLKHPLRCSAVPSRSHTGSLASASDQRSICGLFFSCQNVLGRTHFPMQKYRSARRSSLASASDKGTSVICRYRMKIRTRRTI